MAAASVVLGVSLPAAAVAATPSSPEHIRSYAVTLELGADGLLRVHEDIGYDFGDASGRHGIERDIPTDRVAIGDVRVSSTDAPAVSQITKKKHELDVRIGDAATAVTGLRHYAIDYDVRHVVASDTLDWNAIGTEWPVPIDVATVVLKGPAAFRSLACEARTAHATSPCKGVWNTGGGNAAFGQNLSAGQGLTIKAKFPSGAVRNQRSGGSVLKVGTPGLVALGVAVLFVLCGVGLRWYDQWRRKRLPSWMTRADVPPAEVGGIPNGVEPWDPLAVVALDLAARGHVRVADNGRRITLTRVPGATDPVQSDYERAFLESLFTDGDTAEAGPSTRTWLKPVEDQIIAASRLRGRPYHRAWMDRVGRALLPASWIAGVAGLVVTLAGLWADGGIGDVTAIGAALVVLAAAFGRLRPRSSVTRKGQDLSVTYQRFVLALWDRRDEDDAEADLPYIAATEQSAWTNAFHESHAPDGTLPSWYSYTGGPAKAQARFTALLTMFAGKGRPYVAPARVRPRSSSGVRRSSGGRFAHGHGYGDSGGFGGGGHGGGGHGGDGGGGGHSW
ncbi:DUF2207 domain-containing protein [Actinomadura harenae]|uniref:DUF2207 domain-containing protein n=1 Tax=Actinomadura harenae TaxID=2483351 RepID=UPI001315618A|nr:DUF2207 domain-containing protein [Actinomadura harenae]